MRILVLGADGYLGWPTALHLSQAGHDVAVSDSLVRRAYDVDLGTNSLTPIASFDERIAAWSEISGRMMSHEVGDLCDAEFVQGLVASVRPEAIVHFGQQRSAPYSMIDQRHAVSTQTNNLVGTLNILYAIGNIDRSIHLVKLGTMGEYGTPNIDIEEGWLTVKHRGRTDRVLYPKRAGSFYHLSKVHDSHNIEFACRVWGLRATDLNQGIVYGLNTDLTGVDARLSTRFDYDAIFGTVLNRFCVQAALAHPLTVYGTGGQTRSFINIVDTVECIRLAVENPPPPGEFRVFNQFTEQLSVREVAEKVVASYPGTCAIQSIENPRVEEEGHYYNAAHSHLRDLGLTPHLLTDSVIKSLFAAVEHHQDRVVHDTIWPKISWREPQEILEEPAQSSVH